MFAVCLFVCFLKKKRSAEMFVANWPKSNQQVLPTDREWITSLQSAYAYHMSINLVFLPAPISGEPILTTLILSANTIFCLWKGLVCRRWARHSPVSPCIFTRRGLWACSTATVQHPPGNLVAHSSCENLCGARCQALIFSMMLQHSSACYTHGPISTCYGQAGDDRIRCSYLMRSSVYHIWIWFGSSLYVLYSSLLPCCFRLMVILQMHIYMAWRFVVASLECWAILQSGLWLFLDLDSDFSCCYFFFSQLFHGNM
jgi:hypothetical protein